LIHLAGLEPAPVRVLMIDDVSRLGWVRCHRSGSELQRWG
jgi:hypothetical protein